MTRDKKSYETALRSCMDEESEFRKTHIKRPVEPKLDLQLHNAQIAEKVRTMTKLWKRFHKNGGTNL